MKAIFLTVVFLGAASCAVANDGAISSVGGTIELLDEHPNISLVAEHVEVVVDHRSGSVSVECLFVLSNQGEASTVRIGFPETFDGDTGARPFEFFRSTVDGESIECLRVTGNSGSLQMSGFWWVKQVPFGAGETKIVRDIYRAPAGHSIGDRQGGWRLFEYTLFTGASWAGPIEAATISFRVLHCDATWEPTHFSPAPGFSNGCEYSWQFEDFEPGRSGPRAIQVTWRIVPEE